jgi:hypothetical protein
MKELLEDQSLLNEFDNDQQMLFGAENGEKFAKRKSMANFSMQLKEYKFKRTTKKIPWYLTKLYPKSKEFIIIPFSK